MEQWRMRLLVNYLWCCKSGKIMLLKSQTFQSLNAFDKSRTRLELHESGTIFQKKLPKTHLSGFNFKPLVSRRLKIDIWLDCHHAQGDFCRTRSVA